MKKVVGILVCLLALMVCAGALADVEINETNFPDAIFRWIVSGYDSNGDGILSNSEIQAVTEIDCNSYRWGWEIKDLKGIEYFTALTVLRCQYNQLTKLDVSKNTALTELYCYFNQLTKLDVSKNTALEILDCDHNELTTLDVSKNTALTELWCFDNQLTKLDVSKNTALTQLWCFANQLTKLDVSKNTALKQLICNHNQLTSLDVSKCPNIVNAIKTNTRVDENTFWGYGLDQRGYHIVSFDKKVRVKLGNGEYIEPAEQPTNPTAPVSVGKLTYQISNDTATVTEAESKDAKTVTIPATVTVNNKTYKVTAIGASAFKNMKKLTKVTIGKNMKSIGENAFYGCKKLKTIKINSKLLTEKKTGKNAFKGIYKKATITCPKGKAKTYKKWLTKKGVPKTAKIK